MYFSLCVVFVGACFCSVDTEKRSDDELDMMKERAEVFAQQR